MLPSVKSDANSARRASQISIDGPAFGEEQGCVNAPTTSKSDSGSNLMSLADQEQVANDVSLSFRSKYTTQGTQQLLQHLNVITPHS